MFRFLLFTLLFSQLGHAQELDVFSDKPLKQLFFRNAEGSLKNTDKDKWVKRWRRFDGIILKGLNEEVTGFGDQTNETLAAFRAAYPQKLLLLHFNGRAARPKFATKYANANDFLYFLGTQAVSPLSASEDISTIEVNNVQAFFARKNLRNNGSEDVVLVEVNSDGELNWKNTEHAKLLSTDQSNSTITVKRDILNNGKLRPTAHAVYIAQHVSKGPFGSSSQRLWQYNWFDTNDANRALFEALPDFLSTTLTGSQRFFNGIQFDVLTAEHRTANFGYRMSLDIDFDGKPDQLSADEYSAIHSAGVYRFLTNLRSKLPEEKLILADGFYTSQRATWLLNGIESERWPSMRDSELTQWSSGLNRHEYWRMMSKKPSVNYIKIDEFRMPREGKVPLSANLRRLIVAAAVLTDSAVVPAFRPNGLPFHKWPEFRPLKNLGNALSDLVTISTEKLEKVTFTPVGDSNEAKVDFEQQTLNNLEAPLKATHCMVLAKNSGPATLKLTASVESSDTSPVQPPHILYLGTKTQQQETFVGQQPFTAWFSWENLNDSPLCFKLGSESSTTKLKIDVLELAQGLKVEAKVFEKAVLFTNNNKQPVTMDAKSLSPLNSFVNAQKIVKRKGEIVIPARDFLIVRYK